jgi:phage-related protein
MSFAVNFRCKPFWYADGVEPIILTTSGTFVTNTGSVYSEPIITVYGSGEITLMVSTTIVELSDVTGSITLDTSLLEAYSDTSSKNASMSGDFPTLAPGMNVVNWTGDVLRIEIKPNWRYL